MTAAEICGRLKGVRRSRDGWTALCPAHTDRTPSLCIREIDGKILLRCHAGCTAEAVCDALGIRMRDLFLEKDSAARIVAEYRYLAEDDGLLFEVLRYEPKGFRQRRPVGNGGWE